jgi:putative tricarboxylic transport membrane protein
MFHVMRRLFGTPLARAADVRIGNPTDFWAGIAFGGFGLFMALYAATHYTLGSAVRMGPGYFPLWVGGIVALLGLILALRSLRVHGPSLPRFQWRATLFILGGAVAYGYLLKPAGLVLSTVAVVLITAAGGYEFRWREALLLAVALAIFAVAVFIYALGLPFPLWPEIFD